MIISKSHKQHVSNLFWILQGPVKAPLSGPEEPQASTSAAVVTDCESQSSTEPQVLDRKQKLLAVAPKRPYDIDLYHWEDEKLPVPTMIPLVFT